MRWSPGTPLALLVPFCAACAVVSWAAETVPLLPIPPGVVFRPVVDLGNVLTVVTILGTAIFYWGRIIRRLAQIEMKLNLMWGDFKREHELNNDVGRHE